MILQIIILLYLKQYLYNHYFFKIHHIYSLLMQLKDFFPIFFTILSKMSQYFYKIFQQIYNIFQHLSYSKNVFDSLRNYFYFLKFHKLLLYYVYTQYIYLHYYFLFTISNKYYIYIYLIKFYINYNKYFLYLI